MNIGILSFRALKTRAQEEEIFLMRDARAKGFQSRIFRADKFQMVYNGTTPWLLYNGKPFPKCDVVIVRPSVLAEVDSKIILVKQMEMMGIPLFNNYSSILKAKNKIAAMQILSHYGIPMPKTVVIRRPEDIAQAAKIVGGFPLIVKREFGSFGNGVSIIESMRALKSSLHWNRSMYIIQQFVKYSKGRDIRVFVVNGKIVGSMMRAAKRGEFRSNLELGGDGVPVEITEEETSIALRSVQALDLNYGGVDIIRSKEGPVVLEVNSNPGFKGLQEATGINVAGKIIEYAAEYAERHI